MCHGNILGEIVRSLSNYSNEYEIHFKTKSTYFYEAFEHIWIRIKFNKRKISKRKSN